MGSLLQSVTHLSERLLPISPVHTVAGEVEAVAATAVKFGLKAAVNPNVC